MTRTYFTAFGLTAVVLSVVAAFVVRRSMASLEERWEPKAVVVAREATPAGTALDVSKLNQREVPTLFLSEDELVPSDLNAFAGKKLRIALETDDVLRRGYFSERDECLESVRSVAVRDGLEDSPSVRMLLRALERDAR